MNDNVHHIQEVTPLLFVFLSKEEIEEKLKAGVPYVIRLKMPYEGETVIYLQGDMLDIHQLLIELGHLFYYFQKQHLLLI